MTPERRLGSLRRCLPSDAAAVACSCSTTANGFFCCAGVTPRAPHLGEWWFTIGGGCETDETTEQAARRELREETGVEAEKPLGAPVHHREATFEFGGTRYQQAEDYFVARTTSQEVRTDGWTDDERRAMTAYRWWSLTELSATAETVYPEDLGQLLARLSRADTGPLSSFFRPPLAD